jgi:hypothetical protein
VGVKVSVGVSDDVAVSVGVKVSVGVNVNVGVSVSVGVSVYVTVKVLVHEPAVAVWAAATIVARRSFDRLQAELRRMAISRKPNGSLFFNLNLPERGMVNYKAC